ncbi:MAG: cytochrome c oxidase subunit 3 [bacterium]|jgi:heme/copper-type cytochrome/quinol oxidase subunit 3|nr:heme-copper oxidase subunit III [Planctomycetota bacterium]HIL52826.1 heme-copper oxidase subunit III [Planctomycetota bacterium]
MTSASVILTREEQRTRVDVTLGMIFFIGSWAMTFGTIFLSFLVLRQRIGVWPPEGIALPSFPLASAATAILIASSVLIHRAARCGQRGEAGFARLWSAGLILGLGFAALQAWLWLDLIGAGRLPTSGLYESLFFGLTWIHATHVVLGLAALAWALIGFSLQRYDAHKFTTISNIAIFWHFVDVVWIVLFLGIFVF